MAIYYIEQSRSWTVVLSGMVLPPMVLWKFVGVLNLTVSGGSILRGWEPNYPVICSNVLYEENFSYASVSP